MSREHEIRRLAEATLPRVLPAAWALSEDYENAKVYRRIGGLVVIAEVAFYPPESRGAEPWLHVSASFPDRLPSWADLIEVKDVIVGDRLALQVLPPRAEYVNLNPHVLHLWAPLGPRRPVPDFRREGMI